MRSHIRLTALIVAIVFVLTFVSSPISAVVSTIGSYTMDEAGVLSEKTKDYITERNYNLEKNCQGAQIIVVALNSIGTERIENYAQTLFEKLKIGGDGLENGVLLLLAVGNKDYYIRYGRGLSSVFTTKVISDIIRNNLEPFFDDGDYDGAAKETFRKLNEIVCRFYDADPSGYAGSEGFGGGGSGRHGSALGLSSCSGGKSRFKLSCNSCGGVLLLGCVACVGHELFSSMGDED